MLLEKGGSGLIGRVPTKKLVAVGDNVSPSEEHRRAHLFTRSTEDAKAEHCERDGRVDRDISDGGPLESALGESSQAGAGWGPDSRDEIWHRLYRLRAHVRARLGCSCRRRLRSKPESGRVRRLLRQDLQSI